MGTIGNEVAQRDEQRDLELLRQILAEWGLNWSEKKRKGEQLELGLVGRELVERARPILAEERRQSGFAPVIGPVVPHRGMDALLGGLRIAEITGGSAETPRFDVPPYGVLSQAQILRARNPMIRLLDRLGRTSGPPKPLPPAGPKTQAAPPNSELARLRIALAQQAQTIPGIQDPRMGIGGRPQISVSRTNVGDMRQNIPWAWVKAHLPFLE